MDCETGHDPTTSNGPSPTATLDEVDFRAELSSRPIRSRNHEFENQAPAALAKEMAENPRDMLQKLVEIVLELCDADTAGISLLETQGAEEVFRWEALAGVFASYSNHTMPRFASPCGVCIDRNATQLMYLPDRCFPALRTEPRFVEALLIPFHAHGQPIGTVWVVSHRLERRFNSEDERIVRTLANFASAGWQLWKACEAAEEASHRKDAFLVMLGHELRNPLAAIQTSIELLQQRGSADGDSGRIFDLVVHQTQHLSRVIDDLVDLPRISIGKLKLEAAPVKVVAIVDEALASTRKVIASHGHHLLDIGSRSATTPSVLDEQSSRLSMSHPLPGA